MITKICIYMINPCVFVIFSILLLQRETTTANQLVEVERDDDNAVTNKCLDKERHALLLFKAGLQDPYGSLSEWTAEQEDCCRWSGVTCNNQTGHVTELEISQLSLVGKISHSLLYLSYLNHLNLSGNSFCGNIPTSIGSLTRLRYLDLSENGFSGIIPSSIGSLTELRDLNLGSAGKCRVESIKWLSNLSHLEVLKMDGISLAKANQWVDVISSLPKLSFLSLEGCELSQVMYPYSSSSLNSSSSILTLYLQDNNLTSSMYHWLFPLTSNSLVDLDLSGNMLDGIPEYLGKLCSLESLYFINNSDVVKFPDFLYNLSGCTSLSLQGLYAFDSQFAGSLSDDIQKFSSLEYLFLSNNHLNGTISEKLWELPKLQTLHVSSNYLMGAISEKIGKSKAILIDLSRNPLHGVPSTDHMSNLSHVEYIDLNSCKIGRRFPKWLQILKNLTRLHIPNASISDTIPLEFWDTWPSQLKYLNLSSNNIGGEAPDLSSNFDNNSVIDLSSNNFHGTILNVASTLSSLNLSRNKFNGGISFICQMVDGFLEFLDLSHNFLTGQLPDCLWHLKLLKVLNLGNNNLFGRLPPSIDSLIKLEVLDLYKNNFYGKLPLSLKNCTSLNLLNLGANKLSGNVPVWIGENLSELYVLILRSNNFFGPIPLQLCQLANLKILDLSINNLHGTIPSCLDNFTNMVRQVFLPTQNKHSFLTRWNRSGVLHELIYEEYVDHAVIEYVDHAMIEWQGVEREFIKSNLGLLKSIDLSSNSLTGKIPNELTNLYELVSLNLSQNTFLGEIPREVGRMKKLLTLDLSRNNFSGGIPISMSQMTSLNAFDVSFNNLSGRIPLSTQLQSFEPSRYDGNAGLCGPPLTKTCRGDEDSKVPSLNIGESEGDGEDTEELWGWFYIGGGTGFVIGFWIACGALLLNRRGRHAFFQFYDSFKDWVYVKVVMFIANVRKG